MSSSKILSKEGLTAYERWELPVVQDENDEQQNQEGESRKQETPELRPPTVEELQQIQKNAYDEAFKQGYDAGKTEGVAAGLEEGRIAGKEQGIEAAKTEMRRQGERINELINALTAPLEGLDEKIEQEILALVIAATKLLVRRELKSDPGQIVAAVRQGVKSLPLSSRNIRVFLHPEDAQLVREAMAIESETEEMRWRIVEDPAMTRGGCQIESDESRVDATVETRLTQVISQVFGGEREGEK